MHNHIHPEILGISAYQLYPSRLFAPWLKSRRGRAKTRAVRAHKAYGVVEMGMDHDGLSTSETPYCSWMNIHN